MSDISTSWTNEEMIRAAQEVARRVSVDEEFKRLALADGAAAIARVDPKPLPPGVVLKFVDNSGPLKTIPLPTPVSSELDEISEEELEAVAGGTSVSGSVYCSCASITVSS
jgi:hypothetical protein